MIADDSNFKQPNALSAVFLVEDVVKSAEYYRDQLGFHFDRFWGEPPGFVMLARGNVEFMLSSVGKPSAHPNNKIAGCECWDAYVRVTNVDPLYEEYKAKGVKIIRHPEVAFYNMKEFEVEDCNGYVLCFGHDVGG